MPASVTVTLLTRPGCHLCDAAREIVTEVVNGTPRTRLVELSIETDERLSEQYGEEIPVVLINDRVHNIWRVDADRLRRALEEATQ